MIKVMVPEGMLKAAIEMMRKWNGYPHPDSKENASLVRSTTALLEASLRWLSDNPIVPSFEDCIELHRSCHSATTVAVNEIKAYCESWQRHMFLASEPDIPEEIKNLLSKFNSFDQYDDKGIIKLLEDCREEHNKAVIEAFNRGKNSKSEGESS